ncbi:MAG: LysR family transcriptional regulator [Anaerovoracaceae bacterium]
MNLFHIRYFLKLAEEQHYTKAAEKLCITQPSLSNAISQLEKELGVRLFEKEGRSIRLTELGKQFYDCASTALQTLDSGIETLQLAARGDGLVRLGILRTLGVTFIPNLIADFKKAYPDNNVVFTIDSGISNQLTDKLERRGFDIVFATPPHQENAFDCVPVSSQDLVLIVPEDHPLSDRHSVDLRETLEYPYIHFKKLSGLRTVIDALYEKIDARPNIIYEIDEDQVIAGMVSAGFGIAIVPYMEILHRLNVRILQISYPSWERRFYMITNKNCWLSPPVYNFRQFVMEKCADSLSSKKNFF